MKEDIIDLDAPDVISLQLKLLEVGPRRLVSLRHNLCDLDLAGAALETGSARPLVVYPGV